MYLFTVSERMKKYLEECHISPSQADRLMGNKPGYLRKTKNPGADYVSTFCDTFPEVSAEWLIRGCGSMTLDDAPSSGVPTPTEDSAVLNEPGMDAAQTIITLRAQISQLLATIASQQQTIASQQDTISTLCNTNSQK